MVKGTKITAELKFILFLPILHTLTYILGNYLTYVYLDFIIIRAAYFGLILLFFMIIRYKPYRINNLIVIFSLYLFLLSFLSSDILGSLSNTSKVVISTLSFTLGFYYFDSIYKLHVLNKVYFISLIIFIIYFIVSNIFDLGISDYAEDSITYGTASVNMTKTMIVILFIYPVFILKISDPLMKRWVNIVFIIALILIIIGVKRTVIIGAALGLVIYAILSVKKTRTIRMILWASILLIVTSPLYFDTLKYRFIARQEMGRFDLATFEEKEGRWIELNQVIETFQKSNINDKLFGRELFIDYKFFKTGRMLHMDYTAMLNGAGLLGLFMFLMIYWLFYKSIRKYYKQVKHIYYYKELWTVGMVMLSLAITLGIAGTIYAITTRSFFMMYLGAILGVMKAGAQANIIPPIKKK